MLVKCWCEGRNERCAWCAGTGRRTAYGTKEKRTPKKTKAKSARAKNGPKLKSDHGSGRDGRAIEGDDKGNSRRGSRKSPAGILCPVCANNVSKLTFYVHLRYVHGVEAITDALMPVLPGEWARYAIRCPVCGQRMRVGRLLKHLARAHRISYPRTGSQAARKPHSNKKRLAAHDGRAKNRELRVFALPSPEGVSETAMDGARGFHTFARDHGQFGSFPSHDNYGEEGIG